MPGSSSLLMSLNKTQIPDDTEVADSVHHGVNYKSVFFHREYKKLPINNEFSYVSNHLFTPSSYTNPPAI